jgi:hypothetical protein
LDFSYRKSLGITVIPEMQVLVKATKDTSIEKVREKIRKKSTLDNSTTKLLSSF